MIREIFPMFDVNATRAVDPNFRDSCADNCSCCCTANDPKKDDYDEDVEGENE